MGKLVVTEFVTLDGVGQAPGEPDEDREGGFEHGGWQAPLLDEETGAAMFEQARRMDALLLGRKTYDIFARYWPKAPEEMPFTGLLNRVPKFVVSRTLEAPLAWQSSTLVEGDLADGVGALKERHDETHVIGSLDLVRSLLGLGLVDTLHLWMYPLVLGSGKRVFSGGEVPTALRLTESVSRPNGALQLTYEAAGVPTYGNLAIEADDMGRLAGDE
jgi:dihydrofolate reductase